jgi:hypothetical protein
MTLIHYPFNYFLIRCELWQFRLFLRTQWDSLLIVNWWYTTINPGYTGDTASKSGGIWLVKKSSSAAHYSPLLDIGLSNFSPTRSILSYSHPAPASCLAKIVTPPGLRAFYTTFTETRSPLQNLFSPAVVGLTADLTSPLPLQHAYTVCYVGDGKKVNYSKIKKE